MKSSTRHPLVRVLSLSLALLLLLLSACSSTGGSEDNNNNGNNAEQTGAPNTSAPDDGGEQLAAEQVLNLRYTELERLDVNDARNANEYQVMAEVFEGLFRSFSDENGVEVIENAGCTGYDVSEDGLTYTFHLREESVWTDGVPVTAQNYVDSWLRLIDPEGTFPSASDAFSIVGARDYYYGEGSIDDVAINYIDDYTFSITLEAPDATFIKRINQVWFYPIRKDLIDAAVASGADWTNDYTLYEFNGPFIISDRVLENNMTLTKNETYWDADNVILTQVNFQVVTESQTVAQLVENQNLDATYLGDLGYIAQWQPLVDNGTLVHAVSNQPVTYFLVLCQHAGGNGGLSGLMLNPKVRLAMSLAIDREEFIQLFLEGYNTPAYGLIPYGMTAGEIEYRSYRSEPLLDAENAAIAADPDALRALFEEGAREAGYTGDISDITLTTMVYNPTTSKSNMLEWFKQSFENGLGCQVEIVICPDLSAEQSARKNYEYDFYEIGWEATFNDPISFLEYFVTNGSYAAVMGGFSDEEYDNLVSQISSTPNESERLELMVQAENILITKAGIVPLYYSQTHIYYQSYIKNLSLPTFGAMFEFSRSYIAEH